MIAVSLPMTWQETCRTTSGMTGLTLPGHDRRALLQLGQEQLADAGARARAHQREVVGDLRERDRDDLEHRPTARRARRGWPAPRTGPRAAGSPGRCPRESCARTRVGELRVRVQAGAGRGAAERDLPRRAAARPATRCWREADLRGVAGELLAERDRHGVHEVRAAGLDDVLELVGLGLRTTARARRARAAAGSSPRPARRGARRSGRRRSTTGPCSRGRSGARRSPARFAMTSLAFMFDEVPEPVWKTSIGNWSSCSPLGDLVGGRRRCARRRRASSSPSSAFDARRGALDAPEPAHDRHRDALARDREVVDRLGRLAAPELLSRRHEVHRLFTEVPRTECVLDARYDHARLAADPPHAAALGRPGRRRARASAPASTARAFAADARDARPGPVRPARARPTPTASRCPPGFTSRVIARGGEPVAGTAYPWHVFTDGQATFPTPRRRLDPRHELRGPAAAGGGASSITLRPDGQDHRRAPDPRAARR